MRVVCVPDMYIHSIDMHPSIRTYKYSYTNKARTTHVMLVRTTSLACAQSPKPLSYVRAVSKARKAFAPEGLTARR